MESCKKWLKTFFDVKNATTVDMITLPAFQVGLPEVKKDWKFDPKDLFGDVNEAHQLLVELKGQGM